MRSRPLAGACSWAACGGSGPEGPRTQSTAVPRRNPLLQSIRWRRGRFQLQYRTRHAGAYLWVRGSSDPHQARCSVAASASCFSGPGRSRLMRSRPLAGACSWAACGGSGPKGPRTQSTAVPRRNPLLQSIRWRRGRFQLQYRTRHAGAYLWVRGSSDPHQARCSVAASASCFSGPWRSRLSGAGRWPARVPGPPAAAAGQKARAPRDTSTVHRVALHSCGGGGEPETKMWQSTWSSRRSTGEIRAGSCPLDKTPPGLALRKRGEHNLEET